MAFDQLPPAVIERARATSATRPPVIRITLLEEYVDGWLSVDLDLSAKVGDEPLADASVVSDHVVAMPTKFTVEGIITDFPLKSSASANGQRNVTQYTTGQSDLSRANEARRAIDIIVATAEVFQVDTPWGVYPEVVIRSAHFSEKGLAVRVRLGLQAIRVVEVPATPAFQVPATGRTDGVRRGRVTTTTAATQFSLAPQQIVGLVSSGGRPQEHLTEALQDMSRKGETAELGRTYNQDPAEARRQLEARAQELLVAREAEG